MISGNTPILVLKEGTEREKGKGAFSKSPYHIFPVTRLNELIRKGNRGDKQGCHRFSSSKTKKIIVCY